MKPDSKKMRRHVSKSQRARSSKYLLEAFEPRVLLSASPVFANRLAAIRPTTKMATSVVKSSAKKPIKNVQAETQLVVTTAATSSYSAGFSPSQIKHAYGFDKIQFDGTGQTIAVVDPYGNSNIQSDLSAFSAQFGLPQFGGSGPALNIFQQNGASGSAGAAPPGSSDPLEIALDVEWIHALAPQANIDLVEANSDQFSDMFTAVNTAKYLVVSARFNVTYLRDVR